LEKTEVPGENHRPVCSKLFTNVITQRCIDLTVPWVIFQLTTLVVVGTDCIGSWYKSKIVKSVSKYLPNIILTRMGYHGIPLQPNVDNTDWRMINIFYAIYLT
jgi:hypothetical protein